MERTRAIVLSKLPYNDQSMIVRMYSERYGSLSFLIRGSHKARNGRSVSLFFPMTELDIDFHYDVRKNLHSAKELRLCQSIAKASSDLLKQNICLFLSEVLNKALKEVPSDPALYEFLSLRIGMLIEASEGIMDFHLHFLAELSCYLGFSPVTTSDRFSYFDLREGCFVEHYPLHPDYVEGPLCMAAQRLFSDQASSSSWAGQRPLLLSLLMRYYALHIPEFGQIQSLEVLQAVWT